MTRYLGLLWLAPRAARVALRALFGGFRWDRPTWVEWLWSPPGLTEFNDNGVPTYKPLRVVFSEPAAALRLVQKVVTEGIDLSPAMAGSWMWTTDRELEFTPKDDWPVGRAARR